MSLDLLLLSFQAGMLAQCGELNQCIKRWSVQKITGGKLRKVIADHLATVVHSALHKGDYSQNLADLLGWNPPLVCLPLSGGVSKRDALYLLNLLWQNRESFVVIGARNMLPRCLAILFVLWQTLYRTVM